MQTPDFDSYTEAQLRQVLSRIDAEKYPDRVQEIEARLASMPAVTTGAEKKHAGPVTIAGVWRRFGAFFIDVLILSLVGVAAGAMFRDQFTAMGAWGRPVGFVIAVAYFGIMDSRVAGGGSIGKLVCHLQVTRRDGTMVSVPAAFIRAAIFCSAYFLNGAYIHGLTGNASLVLAQSIVIGMLIFSVFYLLFFNRRTRQSMHDLAVGAFVVKVGSGAIVPPPQPVWRGHVVIIAMLLLAVLVAARFIEKPGTIAALMVTQQAIDDLPGIDRVSINQNEALFNDTKTRRLFIGAVIDGADADPEATATQIAQVALDTYAEAGAQHDIIVTLATGYDIGIFSYWRSTEFAFTPAQWRTKRGKRRA